MPTSRKAIGQDGHLFEYGSNIRVDRGLPPAPDHPPSWFIYKKTDVSADPDTTHDERWDEVASFVEEEAGVMPTKAHERAVALASKE